MKLHDDVMNDLVTLYSAGEASAATRALVEEHLREHPDQAASLKPTALKVRTTPVPQDACMKALNRARKLTLLRLGVLGFAITTLVVPMHPFFWENKTFVIVAEGFSAFAFGIFVYLSERIRKIGLR